MRVGVVGGKLQGVEAVYLALKAGWEVVLFDKRVDVPAAGLCHSFVRADVTDLDRMRPALSNIDLIIPALEDEPALSAMQTASRLTGVPLAFDGSAYRITASKTASNHLFSRIGVPTPRPWPDCGFPVICKPNDLSGSQGIVVVSDPADLDRFLDTIEQPERWVLQEYVDGPSYSIEVLGLAETCLPLQITDLHMDDRYDCKRVVAPTRLAPDMAEAFAAIAVQVARAVQLTGVMDVEAILHEGELKVLEIDARLPSQTPTAVYASTGLNIVEMLGDVFLHRRKPEPAGSKRRGVVFEHLSVIPGRLEFRGEHVITEARPLSLVKDFFGADEALTDYVPGRESWVATLITSAEDLDRAWEKRNAAIENIIRHFGIDLVRDPVPPEIS